MYELKRNGKVFTSKFVGTGPSFYEKRIYRAAVSNTGLESLLPNTCWNKILWILCQRPLSAKNSTTLHKLLSVSECWIWKGAHLCMFIFIRNIPIGVAKTISVNIRFTTN